MRIKLVLLTALLVLVTAGGGQPFNEFRRVLSGLDARRRFRLLYAAFRDGHGYGGYGGLRRLVRRLWLRWYGSAVSYGYW